MSIIEIVAAIGIIIGIVAGIVQSTKGLWIFGQVESPFEAIFLVQVSVVYLSIIMEKGVMLKQKLSQNRFFQAVGLLLLLSVGGCQTRIPDSDPTPPRITLYVTNERGTGEVREITTDETIPIERDDEIGIIAIGTDPQGVREVYLLYNGFRWCEGVPGAVNLGGGPSYREDPMARAGDVTTDTRLVSLNVRGAIFYSCPPGVTFSSSWVVYGATALNFDGGRVDSPQLTLVAPGR